MKTYSRYFKQMMIAAIVLFIVSLVGLYYHNEMSLVLLVAAFICWYAGYAGIMAPDNEKYCLEMGENQITREAIKWWNELTLDEKIEVCDNVPTNTCGLRYLTIEEIKSYYQIHLMETK